MSANTQLDLEGKAEQAFIAWLKSDPRLSVRRIVSAADESSKENGTISVKAKRGAESAAPSGIWEVDVEIELQLRIKRQGESLADFRAIRAAIAERLEVQWRILCRELTAMRTDWHCYYFKILSTNHDPADGQHHSLFTLQIEAMPITFEQAKKTQNPPGRTVSFQSIP